MALIFGRRGKPDAAKTREELIAERIDQDGDLAVRIYALEQTYAQEDAQRRRGRGLPAAELNQRIEELDRTLGAEVQLIRDDLQGVKDAIDAHELTQLQKELQRLEKKLKFTNDAYEAQRARLVGYRDESLRLKKHSAHRAAEERREAERIAEIDRLRGYSRTPGEI